MCDTPQMLLYLGAVCMEQGSVTAQALKVHCISCFAQVEKPEATNRQFWMGLGSRGNMTSD
jgi:hypothetical protein